METESLLLKKFIGYLKELPDVRREAGQRHQQDFVLMIVLFATMSGYIGYRAIGDFIEKHHKDLIALFKPKKNRVPSYSTVRRVLMHLNPKSFHQAYQKWLEDVRTVRGMREENAGEANRWHAVDGKAVRGANRLSETDYTHLVSIFATFDKVVVDSEKVNAKTNEIPCVQEMIEQSDLEGVIFTIDALHCQKKL
jgi:hypothetical protein